MPPSRHLTSIVLPLTVAVLLAYCGVSAVPPIVMTEYGIVIGSTVTVIGLDKQTLVNSYLGIPFARPPVGDLRFEVSCETSLIFSC